MKTRFLIIKSLKQATQNIYNVGGVGVFPTRNVTFNESNTNNSHSKKSYNVLRGRERRVLVSKASKNMWTFPLSHFHPTPVDLISTTCCCTYQVQNGRYATLPKSTAANEHACLLYRFIRLSFCHFESCGGNNRSIQISNVIWLEGFLCVIFILLGEGIIFWEA